MSTKTKLPPIRGLRQEWDGLTMAPGDIKVDPKKNTARWAEVGEHEVQNLAAAMFRDGNRVPVEVIAEEGEGTVSAELVSGYTRHRAAEMIVAGFDFDDQTSETPVRIHNPEFRLSVKVLECSAAEARHRNWTENTQRNDLTPMDRANIVKVAREEGVPDAEIARYLSCDVSFISQLAHLLKLPVAAQRKVHAGKIPMRAAMAAAQLPPKERDEVLQQHNEYIEGGKQDKSKRLTVSKVAGVLAKVHEETGGAGKKKTISRTGGALVQFWMSYTGNAEPPALRKFANANMAFIQGKSSETTFEKALQNFLTAPEADRVEPQQNVVSAKGKKDAPAPAPPKGKKDTPALPKPKKEVEAAEPEPASV